MLCSVQAGTTRTHARQGIRTDLLSQVFLIRHLTRLRSSFNFCRHATRLLSPAYKIPADKTLVTSGIPVVFSEYTAGKIIAMRAKGVAVAKGAVNINIERCKACGFCVEFCPTKVLALSSAFSTKGYHPPHVVAPEKCSGCDLCGMYCPDFAIYGYRIKEPLGPKEVAHAS